MAVDDLDLESVFLFTSDPSHPLDSMRNLVANVNLNEEIELLPITVPEAGTRPGSRMGGSGLFVEPRPQAMVAPVAPPLEEVEEIQNRGRRNLDGSRTCVIL